MGLVELTYNEKIKLSLFQGDIFFLTNNKICKFSLDFKKKIGFGLSPKSRFNFQFYVEKTIMNHGEIRFMTIGYKWCENQVLEKYNLELKELSTLLGLIKSIVSHENY